MNLRWPWRRTENPKVIGCEAGDHDFRRGFRYVLAASGALDVSGPWHACRCGLAWINAADYVEGRDG